MQIQICRGMVSGLKYLHDNLLIHGNFTPENVLFSAEQYDLLVKISDYGVNRTIQYQTAKVSQDYGLHFSTWPRRRYHATFRLYSLGLVI